MFGVAVKILAHNSQSTREKVQVCLKGSGTCLPVLPPVSSCNFKSTWKTERTPTLRLCTVGFDIGEHHRDCLHEAVLRWLAISGASMVMLTLQVSNYLSRLPAPATYSNYQLPVSTICPSYPFQLPLLTTVCVPTTCPSNLFQPPLLNTCCDYLPPLPFPTISSNYLF